MLHQHAHVRANAAKYDSFVSNLLHPSARTDDAKPKHVAALLCGLRMDEPGAGIFGSSSIATKRQLRHERRGRCVG